MVKYLSFIIFLLFMFVRGLRKESTFTPLLGLKVLLWVLISNLDFKDILMNYRN